MKKNSLFFIILAICTLVFTACSDATENNSDTDNEEETSQLEYTPEDVNPDTDVCEVCAMAIADDAHATQIILKNDKSVKFDDLGDLYGWLEENGEDDVGAKFVRDFISEEWLQLEDATYVYAEEIDTPMGFGVIAFKDHEDADAYVSENDYGEVLTSRELDDHEWGAMDHDHEHGFHTEGFDMHFTELDNVTVDKEVQLEVNLTIDENALDNAMVRYEIWQDNEKESTEWIDANEEDGGSYVADYMFENSGTYHIQIHVEDDKDLHEHLEYEISVKE